MKQRCFGLYPCNYPTSVRWQVDYPKEFIATLQPAEKAWLARFLDETVGTHFRRKRDSLYASPEERRVLYRAKNAANVDAYTQMQRVRLTHARMEAHTKVKDVAPTPGYLLLKGYREALSALRATLSEDKRGCPPPNAAQYKKAHAALQQTQRGLAHEKVTSTLHLLYGECPPWHTPGGGGEAAAVARPGAGPGARRLGGGALRGGGQPGAFP